MADQASGGASKTFVKGGCGCIVAFFVGGFFIILLAGGGRVHADIGGLILLFVVGGLIALAVSAFRGKRKPDPGAPPPPASGPWLCTHCGCTNPTGTVECGNCGRMRPTDAS